MTGDLFQATAPAAESVVTSVALSLTQPWATLVAIGAKRVETRSWPVRHRGWLAIHASKGFPPECVALLEREPYRSVLAAAGISRAIELPLGQVLAVVDVTGCFSTNHRTPDRGSHEYAFGNYGPDRYGWTFSGTRPLRQPFAAKGALSVWRLPRPIQAEELLANV